MHRLVLLALFAAACGSSSKSSPSPETAKPAATDYHATCVQVFQRSRTCTDDYIPALVDTRARIDQPPGIAAEVQKDRAGVIAQAKTEWASDSQDAAIDQNCTRAMAAMQQPDPAEVTTAQDCLAKADCAQFVSCIMPTFEKHLHK